MNQKNNKIKVLIVDDSALIRQTLSTILKEDPLIEVIGTAINPNFAAKKIIELKPDVLLLDIQMPQMDGLTFLKKIIKQKPMPVIIFSSYAEDGSLNALKALEYGAVDVIEKPKITTINQVQKYKDKISQAIKTAAIAKITGPNPQKAQHAKILNSELIAKIPKNLKFHQNTQNIIAIGASTGGTEAIRRILQNIPEYFPPIVITQHMPVGFTNSFANRLNELSTITVKEAENNEPLLYGHAYIARGDRHLIVRKQAGKAYAILQDSAPVNRHKPSVDVLFKSVAETYHNNAIGIILTGMGADGAKGLKMMKEFGAHTIAQNEETCVVFGMPKVAIKINATDITLPIYQITDYLKNIIKPKIN
jgi:two-component system chemotaxis response regulator CheB